MSNRLFKGKDITPSDNLNILLCFLTMGASMGLMYLTSHTDNTIVFILGCLAFGFVNNTIFALMHEATHSILHTKRSVNNTLGKMLAAFFPSSFSVQKVCHLGHHRRNRTDVEFFEAYTEGDSKFHKTLSLYGILTGVYWTYAPLAGIVLMLSPKTLFNSAINGKKNKGMAHYGGEGMLSGFAHKTEKDINGYRLEYLATFLFQIALFIVLDLSFFSWLACYWSFAVMWGSIQYADHAYTERDVRHGAWNLKSPEPIKKIFLNYHYHLVHHKYPHIPWIHLPNFVEPGDKEVSHWKIYKKMWKGPVKVDKESKVVLAEKELLDLIALEPFTE